MSESRALLIIQEILFGFFRWIWRQVMSLLSPKSTVTITPLSAQYYQKGYKTVGAELVEEWSDQYLPKTISRCAFVVL